MFSESEIRLPWRWRTRHAHLMSWLTASTNPAAEHATGPIRSLAEDGVLPAYAQKMAGVDGRASGEIEVPSGRQIPDAGGPAETQEEGRNARDLGGSCRRLDEMRRFETL